VSLTRDIHECGERRFTDMSRRFFGYGMVAVGLTFVPVATMTYVSDCYLPVNADALLLVNGLKVCFLVCNNQ
jgi:hypothetical protein